MAYKTAPNYLSGVSVFYGDDITQREIDGELVVFVGPATKGPGTAVDLRSIDNITAIYGNDNPLVKAAFEFWDGFLDSKQVVNLRPVALRVGGIKAFVTFSFGVTLTTTDAFDGIEEEFFVFVDNTSDADSRNIKIWNKNKLLVFDQKDDIDAGYFTVEGALDGSTDTVYGQDLTNNPTLTGVTLSEIALLDEVTPAVITGTNLLTSSTSIVVTGNIQEIAPSGTAILTLNSVKQFVDYTVTNYATNTIGIEAPAVAMATYTVTFVGSTLVLGDSELGLSNRDLYEKYRTALLDVETYTPDYLVPGGVVFDAKDTYVKTSTLSTTLASNLVNTDTYVYVSAAATWATSGLITVDSTGDELNYTSKTLQNSKYALGLDLPVFKLGVTAPSGASTLSVVVDGTDALTKLNSAGSVKISTYVYAYTGASVNTDTGVATVTLAEALPRQHTTNTQLTKVPSAATSGDIVTVTFTESVKFECGIGYVKETDTGSGFTFEWSDTKYVPIYDSEDVVVGHEVYNLAHFGYLFAKFCNDAAIGYNTPLCGMNVSLPTDVNSRSSLATWIGQAPTYIVQGGNVDNITAVGANGTGLLGDPVMAGSINFNRTGFSNPADNKFSDPAYGMLLTDEGFIDGGVLYDTYSKVVDLGKFMCVGAGLLTFTNRGKNTSYVDTMGIYTLGQLAGAPKNEGVSFSRIGTRSNVAITSIISRSVYNDLVRAGYVVTTREKGLGWVINNDNSAVRRDSGYFLLSTTRTIKDVIERKRTILVNYIGKPVNRFYLEAARTKIAESFASDIQQGFLNGYTFTLDPVIASTAIGKLLLKTSLNPPLELVQVDIDAVIDRNVTNQG